MENAYIGSLCYYRFLSVCAASLQQPQHEQSPPHEHLPDLSFFICDTTIATKITATTAATITVAGLGIGSHPRGGFNFYRLRRSSDKQPDQRCNSYERSRSRNGK